MDHTRSAPKTPRSSPSSTSAPESATLATEPLPVLRRLTVPFYGDTIELIERADGLFLPYRPLCDRFGVSFAAQTVRTRDKSWACVAKIETQIPGDDQRRQVLYLSLRSLPMWLATLNPRKVAPEARPALDRYQAEAAEVLYRAAFERGGQLPALPAASSPVALGPSSWPFVKPTRYSEPVRFPLAAPDGAMAEPERVTFSWQGAALPVWLDTRGPWLPLEAWGRWFGVRSLAWLQRQVMGTGWATLAWLLDLDGPEARSVRGCRLGRMVLCLHLRSLGAWLASLSPRRLDDHRRLLDALGLGLVDGLLEHFLLGSGRRALEGLPRLVPSPLPALTAGGAS